MVVLAERIDCFLSTLERGDVIGSLSRDCRQDLDLLGVLVDCCQDQQRLLAAEEARHLHGLVVSYRRGSPGEILAPSHYGLPEEDDSEME